MQTDIDTATAIWVSTAVQAGRDLQVTPLEHDLAVIKATHALASPLGQVKLLERCGRVILVRFVDNVAHDPVLPIPTFRTSDAYEKAFSKFAQHIAAYVAPRGWTPERDGRKANKWWKKAKGLCDQAIEALGESADQFHVAELEYTVSKLQVALAFPGGAQ